MNTDPPERDRDEALDEPTHDVQPAATTLRGVEAKHALVRLHLETGDAPEAFRLAEEVMSMSEDPSPALLRDVAAAYDLAGDRLRAIEIAETAMDAAFERSLDLGFEPHISRYNITCGHALLGHPEEALDWLEVAFRLQEILAMVGDGHTGLRLNRLGLKRYPVRFYACTDGLIIHRAAPEHANLVGCRVVKIGDRAPEEAVAAVRPYISRDNEMGVRANAPRMLSVAECLAYLGITETAEALPLVLERPGGERFSTELTPSDASDASDDGWVEAGRDARGPAPLFRRNQERAFWFEHLVIDLRWNGGGNSYLNPPLVRAIIKSERINRPGRLFVIAGRHTFSAAQNLATDIEFHAEAIFVGEPTGSRPNYIGESSLVTLPYTGFQLTCSSRYHQHSYSNDHRTWIAPDVVAELTWEDVLSNGDPALEAILAIVRDEG